MDGLRREVRRRRTDDPRDRLRQLASCEKRGDHEARGSEGQAGGDPTQRPGHARNRPRSSGVGSQQVSDFPNHRYRFLAIRR